jgi:ABC-type phosphate/phosphonate transport system substrate-binding protein
VDRFSLTGFILPAARLSEAKVSVAPVWLGTHEGVLGAVRDARVAAGATYSGHAASDPRLRVLASTGTIANEPLFVQSSVPADVRRALGDALLAEPDPGVLDGLAGATGFRIPAAGTYEAALATVRAAGQRAEDVVPGGWRRANEHRRPLWSYGP